MPFQELTVVRTILDECQEAIGYQFTRPEFLRAALTHTSGANTRAASNERLEFLGDSVLGLVTCEQLFLRFPDYQEGDLTKVKSVVVSRKTCAAFSQEIGLGDFLFLGKGVSACGEIPSNMLADVFEAVGDPQRLRILVWVCANAGERFSPREVADGLGAALGTIAYHVRCLSLAGLIAPAGERRVRGARQHFYALTPEGEQVMASLADLFAARAERRRGRW